MATSYDSRRDPLAAFPVQERGDFAARDAQAISPSDSTELPFYGRLLVTNSHATNTENITVIMAGNNQDDTITVALPIAPLTTILLPIVVRRVMATGTGADIKAVLLV
jgi:hypothetical protein